MSSSSIVNILSSSMESFGTGFFVSPEGYILTCKHVLIKAGYRKIGQIVNFKYESNFATHKAEWITSTDTEDLAILHTSENTENYIPLCDRDVSGSTVDSYGFPNGSNIQIKASVHIDNVYDDEKYIQLGNANSVTFGFSGAPIIYDGAAVGIINNVAKTDSNGRLTEIAFAISAKRVLQLMSKYVSKEQICIGYGSKDAKCSNYAISKSEGLCKECFETQYLDAVQSLYLAQNYQIHSSDGFFVTELKYGFSTYYDAIFIIVKFDELISLADLYPVTNLAKKCKYSISQIIIVTNAKLDADCLMFIDENKITIKTKEELIRSLFDFEPYRVDLLRHVNSEQLSKHYIEVYCTGIMLEDKESNEEVNSEEEENLGFDYFDNEDDVYDEYNYSESGIQSDEVFDEAPKMFLKEYVNNYLTSRHKALLILGDYGSGKTSFCYTYALELLDKFIQEKSSFLPILIKLRSYNKAVGIGQLLTDYFVNDLGINNFNISSLKLLLKNINVVLIFDGYDEVAKKVDFDIKHDVLKEICNLAESSTKIILTCRPNFFQNASEFKRIFQNSHFPYEPGEKPLIEFIENSIAELNVTQIAYYINSYQSELKKSDISIPEMLRTIANTHDLTDLAKRPFLLYMILSTLPKILEEGKAKGHTKINASRLYSVYTDNWIRREDSKNKTLIKQTDKELFCKEFAFELYISDSLSLSYKDFPSTIKKHFKDIERIEDIDYFTHDIQSCSFLTSDRTGDFKFIHKSFMEYFVADRIISKLLVCIDGTKKRNIQIGNINAILGTTYLSMEICLFVYDILESSKRDIIKEIIAFFKEVNTIAKSNLLSILAKTQTNIAEFFLQHGVSSQDINHVDFSSAKFKGGTLKDISFENIQFYSVMFDDATFINCDFSGAVFDKSFLNKVKFYNCRFYSSKWTGTNLTFCAFNSQNGELYPRKGDGYCDFERSSWRETTIIECSFYECGFVENKMSSMFIHDSKFEFVDFSSTDISGNSDFKNNILYEVIGEPYEF